MTRIIVFKALITDFCTVLMNIFPIGGIMKTSAFIIALFLIATSIYAQEATLFDGKIDNGGFGGVIVSGTAIDGKAALLVGGGGGWIINHTFIIGGAGMGLANDIEANYNDSTGNPLMLNMGYGGLMLGYIYNSDAVVHFTGGFLVGGGGISFREGNWYDHEFDNSYDNRFGNDVYLVIEPQISVELNLTSWFRLTGGGSYRFISSADYHGLTNSDLAGPSGTIMFKFGKF